MRISALGSFFCYANRRRDLRSLSLRPQIPLMGNLSRCRRIPNEIYVASAIPPHVRICRTRPKKTSDRPENSHEPAGRSDGTALRSISLAQKNGHWPPSDCNCRAHFRYDAQETAGGAPPLALMTSIPTRSIIRPGFFPPLTPSMHPNPPEFTTDRYPRRRETDPHVLAILRGGPRQERILRNKGQGAQGDKEDPPAHSHSKPIPRASQPLAYDAPYQKRDKPRTDSPHPNCAQGCGVGALHIDRNALESIGHSVTPIHMKFPNRAPCIPRPGVQRAL